MNKKEESYHDLGKFISDFSTIFFCIARVNCLLQNKTQSQTEEYLSTENHSAMLKDFSALLKQQLTKRLINTKPFDKLCNDVLELLRNARSDMAHGYWVYDTDNDTMGFYRGKPKVITNDNEWQIVKDSASCWKILFLQIHNYYQLGKTIIDMIDSRDGMFILDN